MPKTFCATAYEGPNRIRRDVFINFQMYVEFIKSMSFNLTFPPEVYKELFT